MQIMSDTAPRLPLEELGASAGFRSDARFAEGEAVPPPELLPEPDATDPIADAYAEGFAAGASAARAEAKLQARDERDAREALALSFARLDGDMARELELRLRETVAALCEAAVLPLAIDQAALVPRIERAAAMLARADDERVIHLNPDDLAFVSPRLSRDWRVQPDKSLPRGSIRVEGRDGGVEDGPGQWSCAIREALARC